MSTCINSRSDDFELCGGGLHLIKHAITKASRAGWSGLRVGVAGNGIIVPCNDIEPIASYLLDHQYMMPVDLLLPEWFIRIHKRAKDYLHESSIFAFLDELMPSRKFHFSSHKL